MSYFVTGATGFLGRFLVSKLLKRKGTIHVLVRKGSEKKLEAIAEAAIAGTGWVIEDIYRYSVRLDPELGDFLVRLSIADRFDDMTVLFADVVGSTTLAVTTDPQEVVRRLNAFFSVVVDSADPRALARPGRAARRG